MFEAANQLSVNEQPRALLLLDPWYFPIHEQIATGKTRFKCPVQILNTEEFHRTIPKEEFDSWDLITKSIADGKFPDKQENLTVNKIGHHVQTDFAIVAGWELCALHGIMPP